ncbi:MAG: ketosteroid isomerase-like enzyme [Actinomycetia bacterium]|nr:ketosteroid isomerase-like enzyme [Actinomycetes bacterium]
MMGGHVATGHDREEVEAAVRHYLAVRDEIDAGKRGWDAMATLFTDDAVFIDPAWGRVEGIEEMRATVFGSAMVGLDDWKFPTEFYAIDGDTAVIKWTQVLPGHRADGTPYSQSGYSTLIYAGDGKFSYEEDLLNMTHVMHDIKESGFQFSPEMGMPPRHPNRDVSKPNRG